MPHRQIITLFLFTTKRTPNNTKTDEKPPQPTKNYTSTKIYPEQKMLAVWNKHRPNTSLKLRKTITKSRYKPQSHVTNISHPPQKYAVPKNHGAHLLNYSIFFQKIECHETRQIMYQNVTAYLLHNFFFA